MGWCFLDIVELCYIDVVVLVINFVGVENSGFIQIVWVFVFECIGFVVQVYLSVQWCLDFIVQWCWDCEMFGWLLILCQLVQNMLVEMVCCIDVVWVYVYYVVECQFVGEIDLIVQVCFVKNIVVQVGEWVVNQVVQLFGGMGYMVEFEVEC